MGDMFIGDSSSSSASDEGSYVTVPSSPFGSKRSYGSCPVDFFSVPTSPTSTGSVPFAWELDLQTKSEQEQEQEEKLRTRLGTSVSFKIFVEATDGGSQHHTMSYADELFHDGQVLPLKPPPRLQYASKNNNNDSIALTAQKSVLKTPFTCWHSSKNSDFDPFAAALEHVKNHGSSPHARSRSLSPLRTPKHRITESKSSNTHHHEKPSCEKPAPEVKKHTAELPAESKVKIVDHVSTGKRFKKTMSMKELVPLIPSPSPFPKLPTTTTKKPFGREEETDEAGNKQTVKAVHNQTAGHCNEKRTVMPEEVVIKKKTVTQYRPQGLFVCLGFGSIHRQTKMN